MLEPSCRLEPMATYFFDIHNVGSAQWDNSGYECADQEAIERRTRELGEEFSGHHDGGKAPVTVTVFDSEAKIVLTVMVDDTEGMRLMWS